jgi:hypothetical protein
MDGEGDGCCLRADNVGEHNARGRERNGIEHGDPRERYAVAQFRWIIESGEYEQRRSSDGNEKTDEESAAVDAGDDAERDGLRRRIELSFKDAKRSPKRGRRMKDKEQRERKPCYGEEGCGLGKGRKVATLHDVPREKKAARERKKSEPAQLHRCPQMLALWEAPADL